jgi:hypothetical protein
LTVSTLETHFSTVKILREYLLDIVVSHGGDRCDPEFLSREGDSEAYINLVNASYVARKSSNASEGHEFRICAAEIFMSEVRP